MAQGTAERGQDHLLVRKRPGHGVDQRPAGRGPQESVVLLPDHTGMLAEHAPVAAIAGGRRGILIQGVQAAFQMRRPPPVVVMEHRGVGRAVALAEQGVRVLHGAEMRFAQNMVHRQAGERGAHLA